MTLSKILCEIRTSFARENARPIFATSKILSVTAVLFVIFLTALQGATGDGKELFRTLAVKGNVTLRHNGQTDNLHTGQIIADGDEIYITADGFAGLVGAGGSVELKRTGRYKASDLAKQFGKSKQSGVARKFADYVAAQMTRSSPQESDNKNYQTKMEVTGSVERATSEQTDVLGKLIKIATDEKEDGEIKQGNDIQRMTAVMPRSGKIFGNKTTLSWLPANGTTKYRVLIRDREHQILFEQNVASNSCIVNLLPLRLKPDECYFWSVRPYEKNDDYRSDEYAICIITKEEQTSVADTLAQLTSELGSLKTATAQLVLAAFYEQNEFFANADICYGEAKRLAPDVEDIREVARRFRIRIGAPTE
ncbi:MAG: hypothetical protein LC116_11200 [Bacteroidetes bacterium]|nr:hypothetical protein [Bacteroidota bacterium]